MNPTIIVQQNIEIPDAGLTESEPSSQPPKKAKSVAAIIRTVPRATGADGSIRLDAAKPRANKPHIGPSDLQDYVNWLQEKFQQDASEIEATTTEVIEARMSSIPVGFDPVVAETAPAASSSADPQIPASYYSSITTETEVSQKLASDAASDDGDALVVQQLPEAPVEKAPRPGFSTSRLNRIDQSHARLPKANVSFDELKVDGEETPAVSFELSPGDTTLSNEPKTKTLPPKQLSALDAEHFIATISHAIASVLTETPEPEFEQKIRTHFESELQARAVHAIAPQQDDAIDTDKLDHTSVDNLVESGGLPVAAMKMEAKKIATEILTSARKEIPTSVAAWDVEDFRWPVVTNQMIVSGSEALDQLCQSTFNMITPGNHRVAIAGLGRGEGTTSIALSLARWAAACGKNVLVVDADLVSPGLTTSVGLAPNLSWINAVNQSLPAAEVIIRSQKSNLCIMPLAQMVSRVTWPRFIFDNLGEVIEQVQSHFDLVILDVGPANQLMAELSRPALLVDATLLVHNGVNSPEFQKTKSRLEMFGLNKFIVAQNRAQQISANVA